MECASATSPNPAVDFFTPLFVDTNISYAIEEDTFPGLQHDCHSRQPALLVFEETGHQFPKHENLSTELNGSMLATADRQVDWGQTDSSLYELIDSLDFSDITPHSHPSLIEDTRDFGEVPCLETESVDTDVWGEVSFYSDIADSFGIHHTGERLPKSGTKRKRCVLENSEDYSPEDVIEQSEKRPKKIRTGLYNASLNVMLNWDSGRTCD